jgi:uncharacterized repeat protein (TIGR04138 family)
METDPNDRMEDVVRRDGRYACEAYQFLQNGLEFTARRFHGERTADGGPYHVTGQQLCEGLRDLAIRYWGPLALDILRQWNVNGTRDFGEMVFLLVEHELMGKRDSDEIEDFDDVYDFAEAFAQYSIDLDRKDEDGEDVD